MDKIEIIFTAVDQTKSGNQSVRNELAKTGQAVEKFSKQATNQANSWKSLEEQKTKATNDRFRAFSEQATRQAESWKSLEAQKAQATKDAVEKQKAAWKSAMTTLRNFVIAAVAVGVALKKVFDFAAEGAGISRVSTSFSEISKQAGSASGEILKSLQEASLGTVAANDLMLASNRAMLLGLGGDSKKLANLMEIAAFRGRAMGLSTTQAFNDIVTGVGRMSPLILDNLGIVIKAEEEFKKYGEKIGKASNELSAMEKRQAILNAVLSEGNQQLAAAGGLFEDSATAYEQLSAALKDYINLQKEALGEGLSPFIGWLAQATRETTTFSRAMRITGKTEAELAKAALDAGLSNLEYAEHIVNLTDAMRDASAAGEVLDKVIDNMPKGETIEVKAEFDPGAASSARAFDNAMQDAARSGFQLKSAIDELDFPEQELVVDSATRSYMAWAYAVGTEGPAAIAAAKEAQEELTKAHQTSLGTLSRLQSIHDTTKETIEEHTQKIADLMEKQSEIPKSSDKWQQYQDSIDDSREAINNAKAASQEAAQQIVFDLVQMRAAADGVITDEEFAGLLTLGQRMGLITPDVVEQLAEIEQQADSTASRLENIGKVGTKEPEAMREKWGRFEGQLDDVADGSVETSVLFGSAMEEMKASAEPTHQVLFNMVGKVDYLKKMSGAKYTYTFEGIMTGDWPGNIDAQATAVTTSTGSGSTRGQGRGFKGRRQGGGPVIKDRPYLVGERGPEVFVPRRNGRILPNDKIAGTTINNIYGPVELSIKKERAGLTEIR